MENEPKDKPGGGGCSRRQFLFGGATSLVSAALAALPGLAGAAGEARLRVAGYPRRRVGRLSALTEGRPLKFLYPHEHPNCSCMLVKLGQEAAGGIGPGKDVVAFSLLCSHMGGPLDGLYKPAYKAVGPCPIHLSTFDLRRHGMVVSGHATESLPQVVLESEGDEIYAAGVMGLLFGFHDNKVSP